MKKPSIKHHNHHEVFKIITCDWAWFAIFTSIILSLVLITKFRRKCSKKAQRQQEQGLVFHGYNKDPPETWKCKFLNSHGRNQSPINLELRKTRLMENCSPLRFSEHYFNTPESMEVINNGFGILIYCCFQKTSPFLHGGPFNGKYSFSIAGFKWGPDDLEGSEHTINLKRYAMELQVMHLKKSDKEYIDIETAANDQAVLVISYFLQITPEDNPYLSPIINALDKVRRPYKTHSIQPFPLCWIFPPFKSGYFFYEGSMTYPPCTEGVSWIIQPEPLGISSKQVQKFRKLKAIDGPMMRNTRCVQKVNDREIYFFN